MIVQVTRRDIRQGVANRATQVQSQSCPVALAIGRALRREGFEIAGVSVTGSDFRVILPFFLGSTGYTPLPSKVGDWVTRFDRTTDPGRAARSKPIRFRVANPLRKRA